jgi:hypothetical protein
MPNLLLQIEKMMNETVESSLLEAADEKGIQSILIKRIKADGRKLKATNSDKNVDEVEDSSTTSGEDNKSSKAGGDMSKRDVIVPDELPASITVDMIIDSIDAIRSARSLKKPEVREEFEKYFNSLDSAEKIALLAFVHGVAQTLIGSDEGAEVDPASAPYNIDMEARPEQSRSPSKTSQAIDSIEKQDASTPIVVGG